MLLIRYSYNQKNSSEQFGLELIHVLKEVLFSKTAAVDLRLKSEAILRRFITDKKFIAAYENITGIVLRNALFPIIYEFSASRIDDIGVLILSSKFFNHPPKIIHHLLYSVPGNMRGYLIPYDERENRRLLAVAKLSERWYNISIYGAINLVISMFYLGNLSVHRFNLQGFAVLYLVLNNLIYVLIKKWGADMNINVRDIAEDENETDFDN